MKSFTFKTGDEAWVSINKLFIEQNENLGLFKEGQGALITNSLFTYGITVLIEEAKFDPEFDFGKIFGYTQSKWSSLLNNYVDLDALDKLKLQIRELEKNKAVNRNYHIGFNFADSHGNGKGCLVSGIFSRMIFIEKPRLSIVMRASDVVTRLPWDILLAVRLGEYVYGHTDFTIELIIRSAFADDFSLMLFNGYEPIEPLIDGIENETRKELMHFFRLQSERYYPGELISHLYMMMGMHLLIGTQEFLDLIRFMIEDIKNYPEFDGKKILWIHLLPFYKETLQSYFNSSRKYQIIASDIIIDSMEEMDETQPFHALAKKIIRNLYNGS